MKYWKATLIFTIGLLIQTTFLNLFAVAGHTPNLLLALVSVFGFIYVGKMYGIILGTVFGLLYDIFYGITLGTTAIPLVLVGVVLILFQHFMNVDNIINMWIVSVGSIFAFYLTSWILQVISGSPLGFLYMLKRIPITAIYTMLVITILYMILSKGVRKRPKSRYFR